MQSSGLLGLAVFAAIVRSTWASDSEAANRIATLKCQHYLDMVSIPHEIMTLEMNSRVRKVFSIHCPLHNPYVVGGRRVDKHEFPHMVALGFLGYSRGAGLYVFECGGTLISEDFVLTAAHCINNDLMIVRVGVADLNDLEAQDFRIEEMIVHKDYSPDTRYDDIALLRLERNVTISVHVRPACLGTVRTERIHRATVTGWGKQVKVCDVDYSFLSDKLGKVSLDVPSDRRKCARMYRGAGQSPLIDRQICAGSLEGNQDACHGDSGGPLQVFEEGECRYHVIGVVSYGKICGSAEYGLYTRVSRYLEWIVETVWPNEWTHKEHWESW